MTDSARTVETDSNNTAQSSKSNSTLGVTIDCEKVQRDKWATTTVEIRGAFDTVEKEVRYICANKLRGQGYNSVLPKHIDIKEIEEVDGD